MRCEGDSLFPVRVQAQGLMSLSLLELRIRLSLVANVLTEARTKCDDRWYRLLPQALRLQEVINFKLKEQT